jgi:hypothetical protein
VVFEDLFVNCLKASKPTTSTARGIYIPNATCVRVNRCLIKDPSYEGVGAWAGQDIGVTNCRFVGGGDSISQGQRSHAIGFSGNTRPYLTDVSAIGNHIEGAMDTGIGLYTAVSNAIILGNTINTATGLAMKAIDLVAPFRSLISNNAIHLTGDCAYAIGLACHTSALSAYDVSIVGNSIEGSGLTIAQGIQLYALASGLSVRRVTITGNVVRGIKNSGIYIGGINGASNLDLIVVTGNVSTGNGGDGLTMTQAGGSNVMTNNVVTANIFNGNTGYGINFGNSIQNGNSIHDNILTGNTAGAYPNSDSSQTIS